MSEIQNTGPAGNLPPKNYLVESILVTLFCCMPLGVVAIINATKVNTAWEAGDQEGALRSAEEAKKWMKYGIIGAAVGIILYLIFIGIMVAIGAMNQ